MKKSILPLLIAFVFVFIFSAIIIGYKQSREDQAAGRPHSAPGVFRRHVPRPGDMISGQELIERIDMALKDIESGNIDTAEDGIRTVLLFAPDNTKAITILGKILFIRGNLLEAEIIFRRQLDRFPDNPSVLNNLAAVLARQKRLTEAREYAEKAAVLAPDNPEIVINLAGLAALADDRAGALYHFRRAAMILGSGIAGFSTDPCFDSIRDTPAFREALNAAMQTQNEQGGSR